MVIYDIQNAVLLDIAVDDTSIRSKVLNGENTLTLNYALAEHKEIPLGAWCVFKGERYSLMSPEDITMNHRRSFEYTLTMHSEDAKAKLYKFINPVDGRLKFSLTAKPVEHLQMFVDNMNKRDSGWTIGECPDHVEVVLSYNHTTCHDALVQLANELELDYWFVGKSVSIGKLELNKDNPLPLSYGGDGAGLKPNIKRNNYAEALPVEILYTQGSETNIDRSKYGASELHLPKSQSIRFDGVKFEGEAGFDVGKARSYIVDGNGYSVKRSDKTQSTHSEDSLDCTEIYPAKEEEVVGVEGVNDEKHFYDIHFDSKVNYSKYLIAGETPRVIFQSGMLAGKEFDLATDDKGNLVYEEDEQRGTWKVELCPKEEDGITMPDKASGYMPAAGDKFKVFGIQLPEEYICDNATKSGAEWDMLRYAVKYLYEHEEPQYTITGELDEIYAKRKWDSISDRLVLGSYISFTDKSFQSDPLLIRIVGIKEYVNKPYSPVLEISNASTGGTLVGALNRLENQDAQNEDRYRRSVDYTKRRWRDTRETLAMLASAFDNFSSAINPVTVETMAMLVGDEMLQFIFTESLSSDTQVEFIYSYDSPTGIVSIPAESFIKHMTLGISSISPTHDSSEYRRWSLPAFTQALEAEKSYYIYAKVSKTSTSGEFVFSETAMKETNEHYYLLVGIMNSEYEGERSFASMYGFTEILPARITTDKVVSSDGETYFDLKNGVIEGKINFKSGSSGLDNVEGWKEMETKVDATIKGVSVEYAVGDSSMIAPETGWQTKAPERTQGQYLWQRTATTTNGGTTYSTATCISGIDGEVGESGASISSVVPLYYLTAKGKPQAPASPVTEVSKVLEAWTKTCPDWENGYSYYTCSQITRTDGTVVFSDVVASGDIKNHIFHTAEDETPKPPYNYGDLWLCAHYKGIDVEAAIAQVEAGVAVVEDDGTVVVDANEVEYTNEILTCINARTTGEEFSINDWAPAADYAKRSDYEYLKDALPETSSVIDGGLVLGTFIGVSDAEAGSASDGNVVAGLCGVKGENEEFYDKDKMAKLLVFAGVDATSQSPVKYKEARVQIWSDGSFMAKTADIGPVSIDEGGIRSGDGLQISAESSRLKNAIIDNGRIYRSADRSNILTVYDNEEQNTLVAINAGDVTATQTTHLRLVGAQVTHVETFKSWETVAKDFERRCFDSFTVPEDGTITVQDLYFGFPYGKVQQAIASVRCDVTRDGNTTPTFIKQMLLNQGEAEGGTFYRRYATPFTISVRKGDKVEIKLAGYARVKSSLKTNSGYFRSEVISGTAIFESKGDNHLKGVDIGANGVNIRFGDHSKFQYLAPKSTYVDGSIQEDGRSSGGDFLVECPKDADNSFGIGLQVKAKEGVFISCDGTWLKVEVDSDGYLKATK